MTKAKVILKDQPEYNAQEIARKALGIIEAIGLDVRQKTVFVKPSFVFPSKKENALGVITQPEFVVGVAMALREGGARRVMVGESSIMGPARVSFEMVGILPMLKGIAEPVYLDEEPEVEVNVANPFVQGKFSVPKIWLDSDVYVNLPKIKTNMFSGITLSIKNNLGLLRQCDRLVNHDRRLHRKLADLYRIRPPDMTIADCIVAGEGQGPVLAEPVKMGLMVGGNNSVAVDVVACRLAGFEPREVEHLDLLIEAAQGPGSVDEIDIEGRELLNRARKFARPDTSLSDMSPLMRVFQEDGHSCPSGCDGMIRGLMDPYVRQNGPDGIARMNIVIGKSANVPEDLDPSITVVVGNCAEAHQGKGQFVAGCCPRPLDVGLILRRIQGSMELLSGEMTGPNLVAVLRAYSRHRNWRMGRLLAGKKLMPIENHVTVDRMLRELVIEIGRRVRK